MPTPTAIETYSIMSDSDDDFMDDAQSEDSDFDFDDEPAPKVAKVAKATKVVKSKSTSDKATKAVTKTTKKSATTAASKKKASATKSNDSRPILAERSTNSDESDMTSGTMESMKKKVDDKKTVEERYQKLTQLEHILVRPDTYSK
jgi:DNA topoisomerase-2